MPPPQGIPQRSPLSHHSSYESNVSPYYLKPTTPPSKYDVSRYQPSTIKETPPNMNMKPLDLPQLGSMPAKQAGFNRVLDGLKKRQLEHDFQLEMAAKIYQPTQNIGSGAFGIVCEAMETSSNQKVAIKKVAHASATPTLARRTLREIRVLRYISHPNIVALRDIFRTKGPLGIDVYLVMDLMSHNLHQIIYGMEPLEEEYIISFLHQLLKGLDYLHAAHIAHRDLKPSNLLVNGDATLRIADFGMAKCTDSKTGKQDDADEHCFYMTQHVATLPYRAPELLFVMPEHSTAVDMWAVGCIFGEMVMREELFPGRSVPGQIRLLLQCFGKPEQYIIDDIRCDRTKKLIEDYGTDSQIKYDELLYCKQRDTQLVTGRCEVIDFVSKLFAIDASERLTVTEALKHRYITENTIDEGEQPKCPFKVKMDMMSVESVVHEKLVEMLCLDVRSADNYTVIHSGESTDTDNSTESSSGGFPSPPDSTQDVSTQVSLCEPDSYV